MNATPTSATNAGSRSSKDSRFKLRLIFEGAVNAQLLGSATLDEVAHLQKLNTWPSRITQGELLNMGNTVMACKSLLAGAIAENANFRTATAAITAINAVRFRTRINNSLMRLALLAN
jgi:hypothetical protein